MPHKYDWLIVTAASTAQARGYEAQLSARRRSGSLEDFANILVVPDPNDRRVGSGGSTLIALTEVVRRRALAQTPRSRAPKIAPLSDLLAGQRILIIHSGGDSRRLPAYAAQGKVFAPLPCDSAWDRQADLFDLVLQDTASIAIPDSGGVLITAGDALLGLWREHENISRAIKGDGLGQPVGFVGVAFKAPAQRGARHGVYILDRAGRVENFLQKPSIKLQRQLGALDQHDRTLVDTGIVAIDPATAAAWLRDCGLETTARGPVMSGLLAALVEGRAPALDLYHHVLAALPSRTRRSEYLAQLSPAPEHRTLLSGLFASLHGIPLRAVIMQTCDFLHIGSTREMLDLVCGDARIRRPGLPAGPVTVYNSPRLDPRAAAVGGSGSRPPKPSRNSARSAFQAPTTVIEACDVRALSCGGDNLIVGLPPALDGKLHLPRGWGITLLPIAARDWACVLFGDRDDCKTPVEAGGTLGNRPLAALLARGCSQNDLWPARDQSPERSLWTARLWPVGTAPMSLELVSWLLDDQSQAPPRWRSAPRLSLSELIRQVNHHRLIDHRDSLQRADRLTRLADRLAANPWIPAAEIAADCTAPPQRRAAIATVRSLTRQADPIGRARLHRLAAELSTGPAARRQIALAFEQVAQAVRTDYTLPTRPPRVAILPDQVVWVTTPVRIDLAGGWSDTPPICNELGGSVVNMAITLNGQFPVQVIARRAELPIIRLSSVDLGRSISYSTSRALCEHHDPSDWAALPKAALVLSGIAPAESSTNLARWLDRFGGGLELTVFSALPKGSGLGTSSVLGAAILACLDRVLGLPLDHPSIILRTSLLEQMMSTAGGWQDQAGGIMPGIKINRTGPGPDQTPSVTPIPLVPRMRDELASRSLLYYTGHRRLARDILQKVVGRYLSRDRAAVRIIHELKALAERLHAALLSADVEEFARCVRANWEYKKLLDPGSTNQKVQAIVRPIETYLSGYEMPGAGGGGFVYMIAKDPRAAARVRALLDRSPANAFSRFFDFNIDDRGLAISQL